MSFSSKLLLGIFQGKAIWRDKLNSLQQKHAVSEDLLQRPLSARNTTSLVSLALDASSAYWAGKSFTTVSPKVQA